MELLVVEGFGTRNQAGFVSKWGGSVSAGYQGLRLFGSGGAGGGPYVAMNYGYASSYAFTIGVGLPTVPFEVGDCLGVSFMFNKTSLFNSDQLRTLAYPGPSGNTTWPKVSGHSTGMLGGGLTVLIGNTQVGSISPEYVPDGLWVHLEYQYARISSTEVSFTLKVGGVTRFTTTFPSNETSISFLTISKPVSAGVNSYIAYYLGSIIFYKTTAVDPEWLGETNVRTIFPSEDISSTDFESTAANMWSTLDNVPPSTSQYITGTLPGAEAVLGLTDLPSTDVVIKGISVITRASKEGTDLTTLTTSVPGATSEEGVLTQDSYQEFEMLFPLNPDTGVQWTAGEINDLEITLNRVS